MSTSTTLRRTAVALLLSLANVACTHVGLVTETQSEGGTVTYTSSNQWRNGAPRTEVRETILGEDDSCEILRVERDFFDPNGALIVSQVDRERCRVVELRVERRYDPTSGVFERTIARDTDRDGHFDHELQTARPMRDSDLAQVMPN